MKRYKVTVTAHGRYSINIEAESMEDAINKVMNGREIPLDEMDLDYEYEAQKEEK